MASNFDQQVQAHIERATGDDPAVSVSRSWFVCAECPTPASCEDVGGCRRCVPALDRKLRAFECDPLGLDLIRGGKRDRSTVPFKARQEGWSLPGVGE